MAARILIVDDERTIADTLSLIFRSAGYEAFTAYNGLIGLDAARTLEPNFVLSDVFMPGLDGVTMAMRILRAQPKVQVLLFSGQADTEDFLRDAEAQGFHFEVLQKPIHPEEILRKVALALPDFQNPGPGHLYY
jgi:CheY-like chemotaxis protein